MENQSDQLPTLEIQEPGTDQSQKQPETHTHIESQQELLCLYWCVRASRNGGVLPGPKNRERPRDVGPPGASWHLAGTSDQEKRTFREATYFQRRFASESRLTKVGLLNSNRQECLRRNETQDYEACRVCSPGWENSNFLPHSACLHRLSPIPRHAARQKSGGVQERQQLEGSVCRLFGDSERSRLTLTAIAV